METSESMAEIEGRIKRFYEGIEPDRKFLERLEREIRSRSRPEARIPTWKKYWRVWTLRMAKASAALLLLSIALTLIVLGPEETLARIKGIIGYVPNAGFVNVEQTLILPEPVKVEANGVIVVVRRVVATPKDTSVSITLSNVPVSKNAPNPARPGMSPLDATLQVPGKKPLRAGGGVFAISGPVSDEKGDRGEINVEMHFPPIPANHRNVVLRLKIGGKRAKAITIPLTLYPANDKLVAGSIVAPYTPDITSQTHKGITLKVLRVAQTGVDTAIQVQVAKSDPDKKSIQLVIPELWEASLYDDVGHVYRHLVQHGQLLDVSPTGDALWTPDGPVYTDRRAPLSGLAKELTYVVPSVTVHTDLKDEFSIDLGRSPRIGQTWPLDVKIKAAGYTLRIVRARLEYDSAMKSYELDFSIQPPKAQGVVPVALMMTGGSFVSSGCAASTERDGKMWCSLRTMPNLPVPQGKVRIHATEAVLILSGPWRFHWSIPRPALPPNVSLMISRPKASAEQNGVTVRLGEVDMSDRVTSIALDVDAPDGVVSPWANRLPAQAFGAYLTDDLGNRYSPSDGVKWCKEPSSATSIPEHGPSGIDLPFALGPGAPPFYGEARWPNQCGLPWRLDFEPAKPKASSFVLHLSKVRLFARDSASLEIHIPDKAAVESELDKHIYRQWKVDIPLEIAGYTLHFTKAKLEMNEGPQIWLFSDSIPTKPHGRTLTSLLVSGIEADGEKLELSPYWATKSYWATESMEGCYPQCQNANQGIALRIPMGNDPLGPVRSVYRVEFGGAEFSVDGNWTLRVTPSRTFWSGKGK